ncbi:hypothetical protein [Haladaptatus halobius]|uniref:hypothetical protein n=1 Tax=Haladaptatus halobius TaxID=2884875 RepID=UPI001D0A05B5|nr:hypothetical protein [Haladaptatus halobius]
MDGYDASAVAMDHGVSIAEPDAAAISLSARRGCRMEMSAPGIGTIADKLTETLEQEAEDVLGTADVRAEEPSITFERSVLEGIPHEAIAE